MMHGFGAATGDLLSISYLLDKARAYNWIFPQAPHYLGPVGLPNGFAWFPSDQTLQWRAMQGEYFHNLAQIDPPDIREAAGGLEELLEYLAIDPARTVIGGFSQGAIMTTELLLHTPRRFAGALLFSGALVAKERWDTATAHQTGVRYLQSHGREDQILPIENGRALNGLLAGKGFTGELIEFTGEHTITDEIIAAAAEFLTERFAPASS